MYYLDDLDDDPDGGFDLDDDGLDLDDDCLEDDPDEALLLESEEGPDFLIYFFSPVLSLMFLYFSSSLL